MSATIAERVAAGGAWLDEHEPGWVDRVDLERLDMISTLQDVAGQLAGSYHGLLMRHLLDDPVPLGLTLRIGDGRWGELTAAWRGLIEARRAER